MTKAEIIAEMKKELADEFKGCCHYADMAKAAEELGENELALGLYLMAKDEYSHGDFMMKYAGEMPPEIKEMHSKAYHRVAHMPV